MLMHPEDELPETEEFARWQVRIEFVAWLIMSKPFKAPTKEILVDARILAPLEKAVEAYLNNDAMALFPDPTEGERTMAERELRFKLQFAADGCGKNAAPCATEV